MHRADASWLAERLADDASRVLLVAEDGVYVNGDSRPALVPLRAAGELHEPVLLGLDSSGALFAAAAPGGGSAPDGARLMGLRDAGALLSPEDAGLLAYATAMVNWHRRHPHCAVCGARTNAEEAGFLRRCPECGAEHHPRTDPVVIMLVHDGDRALLGRQASWPAGRYSSLAGFVEPGESLEEAVAREVAEESGVEVGPPRYVASQPWPFPASLMLGFEAPWVAGEPRALERAIEDVRWFSRAEVAAAAAEDAGARPARPGASALLLPPRFAIARRLVERWLES